MSDTWVKTFASPPIGGTHTFVWDIEAEAQEWTEGEDRWLVKCAMERLIHYGSLNNFRKWIVTNRSDGHAIRFEEITIDPWREVYEEYSTGCHFRTFESVRVRFKALRRDAYNDTHRLHPFKYWYTHHVEDFCSRVGGERLRYLYDNPEINRSVEEKPWEYAEDMLLVGLVFSVLAFSGNFPCTVDHWHRLETLFNNSNTPHKKRTKIHLCLRWKRLVRIYRLTAMGFAPSISDFLGVNADFTPKRKNPRRKCRAKSKRVKA